MAYNAQLSDLADTNIEKRVRLDPLRLAPGGSALARYLELWREARAGDALSLLSRLQARGLDRHVMVLDLDHSGSFVFRFLGSSLTFVDAAARARLVGKPGDAFGDLKTMRAALEGYVIAAESDAPLCEMVDRQRLNAAGQLLPRTPFRRLILPLPVNGRITRAVVASEIIQRPGRQERR